MHCVRKTLPRVCHRAGHTLLELLVILAVTALLVSIAVGGVRPASARVSLQGPFEEVQFRAITARVPVVARMERDTLVVLVTAYPDGHLVVDTLHAPPRWTP